ncbi:MAG: hypothetical protein WCI27_04310 [Candidatus Omnitrophota bacterium]
MTKTKVSLREKGSGVLGGILAVVALVGIVFFYNLSRAYDAMKKFAVPSPAFQYFLDRKVLYFDGKEWRFLRKVEEQNMRMIQYVPAGQEHNIMETFYYSEGPALPPNNPFDTYLDNALKSSIAIFKHDCPDSGMNLLRKEKDFFMEDYYCKERNLYGLIAAAVVDGVSGSLSVEQKSDVDMSKMRAVWEQRGRSLLLDGVWESLPSGNGEFKP